MTTLATRLANMRMDVSSWLGQCSNWQYVTATASINVVAYATAACLVDPITGFNLTTDLTCGVIETVLLTGFLAWRRRE